MQPVDDSGTGALLIRQETNASPYPNPPDFSKQGLFAGLGNSTQSPQRTEGVRREQVHFLCELSFSTLRTLR
jgi:hypothetical protein